MATKTLILRPKSIEKSILNSGSISFAPASYDETTGQALINEAVADDDAGYISVSPGALLVAHFDYKRPSNMLNITDVIVTIRSRMMEGSGSSGLEGHLTVLSEFEATKLYVTEEYAYYEYSFSDKSQIISELNASDNLDIIFKFGETPGGKNSATYTTQLFITIVYDGTETPVYQKVNGTWTRINNPRFYKFSNNAWAELTDVELEHGQKYNVQSV